MCRISQTTTFIPLTPFYFSVFKFYELEINHIVLRRDMKIWRRVHGRYPPQARAYVQRNRGASLLRFFVPPAVEEVGQPREHHDDEQNLQERFDVDDSNSQKQGQRRPASKGEY